LQEVGTQAAERASVTVTLDESGFWPVSVVYGGVEYVVRERIDYHPFPELRIDGCPVEQYIFETDYGEMILRRAGKMFWVESVEWEQLGA